jgi:hypothetical protein
MSILPYLSRQQTTDPFATPTANNETAFEELQVCLLCGRTPERVELTGFLPSDDDVVKNL